MSGAERAIFPILLDFVNWDINHSVILIDELELHCHPPMQQMLLWAIQRLGRGNQIILTTHSDYIADLLPESAVFRLD
jgi:predicted ATP-dependent endonuclease of OLD family